MIRTNEGRKTEGRREREEKKGENGMPALGEHKICIPKNKTRQKKMTAFFPAMTRNE